MGQRDTCRVADAIDQLRRDGFPVGAILLLVADDVARTIVAPAELPVGVITALLDGPFFLFLLKARQQEFIVNA
jgi:ABC-type cobalamin transport system permease subunit